MTLLGVPYGENAINGRARSRTRRPRAGDRGGDRHGAGRSDGGMARDLENTKMIALIAYLQRLGTDLYAAPEDVADGSDAKKAT